MGFDYALVHVKYTIPPAILLTVLYRPLAARVDVYRVLFLVTVAILATTPWDSYLIRHRVWSYPEDSVIGYTLFRIPFEELFFFFIQTYIVSLFYLLWSKPELFPLYLIESENERSGLLVNNARRASERRLGQLIICGFLGAGARWLQSGSSGMYMGLILVWSMPVILFLWSLAHLVIVRMPLKTVLVPILAPTIYLWLVDTLALRRGTWVIEQGTKLGWELWPGLEIEEAVFFLLTNILIVFGQIAWDNALAVLESCPSKFPIIPRTPSIPMLVESLILSPNQQEYADIIGLRQAVNRLRRKSRSFFLANAAFRGRLRMDIISLYSYCRVADDLIDEASSREEAKHNFEKLRRYLEIAFQPSATRSVDSERGKFVKAEFPLDTRSALSLLPTPYLSKEPLEAMLDGFETDLAFRDGDSWPIKDQEALELYGLRVAGTVAELCLNLIFHHSPDPVSEQEQQALIASSRTMGVALQTVNIARDIEVDARAGRVYIPTAWLKEHDLAPGDVAKQPDHPAIPQLRKRLLELAWTRYGESRGAIERLPSETRAPLRTAVENYMEIGRVLAEGRYRTREGKATVPLLRRLRTAWKAMNG